MGLTEDATEIAVLSGAERADWKNQKNAVVPVLSGGGNGVPGAIDDGVALLGSLKTLVLLDLRDNLAFRTSKVTVVTADDTQTYRVIVNGNNVDYVAIGGDLLQEILEGMRDAINADGTVNLIVIASVADLDDDSVDDTLVLKGLAFAHYSVDVSATGAPPPSGDLLAVLEPDLADLRVLIAAEGLASAARPPNWRMINDGEFLALDERGFVERFDTASFGRLYAETDSLSGTSDGTGGNITYAPARVVVAPSRLP